MRWLGAVPPKWGHTLWLVSLMLAGWAALSARLGSYSLAPSAEPARTQFVGAYHVHSDRSHDSRVTPEAWALAAAKRGLDFIVLTDHNAEAQPPRSLHGVLVLFEREASTPLGHEVQFGGGAVAAHPTDLKRPWAGQPAQVAGVEIASNSAAARRRAGRTLVGLLPAGLMAWLSPGAALLQLYDRDDAALALWDQDAQGRLAGLCGADAHGWLPRDAEMRLWHMAVTDPRLSRPLQTHHAEVVRQALLLGRGLCIAGVLPNDAAVTLEVAQGPGGQRVVSTCRYEDKPKPQGSVLQVYRNGALVCSSETDACVVDRAPTGVYRAEMHVAAPWLVRGSRMVPLMYSSRLVVTGPSDGP